MIKLYYTPFSIYSRPVWMALIEKELPIEFFESLLGDNNYFGSQHISLAELVAGSTIPWLPYLGITLAEYPDLNAWSKRLMERKAWQQT